MFDGKAENDALTYRGCAFLFGFENGRYIRVRLEFGIEFIRTANWGRGHCGSSVSGELDFFYLALCAVN